MSLLVIVGAIPNVKPLASFTYSGPHLVIDFDASASVDPDGTIVEWNWDFGDLSTGTGETIQHTYAAAGNYTVTLTVVDDLGGEMIATDNLTLVANVGPTAAYTYVYVAGPHIEVDGSTSSDTDGVITDWDWDWGDGTAHGSGVTATHDYGADGPYDLVLTVTDDDLDTDTETKTIPVVLNQPPVAAFTYIQDGWSVSVDGSTSTDDIGVTSYEWNWGDGSAHSYGVLAYHLYSSASMFTITLTVGDGEYTDDATEVITTVPLALPAPPVLTIPIIAEYALEDIGEAAFTDTAGQPTVYNTTYFADTSYPAYITPIKRTCLNGGYICTDRARGKMQVPHATGEDLCLYNNGGTMMIGLLIRKESATDEGERFVCGDGMVGGAGSAYIRAGNTGYGTVTHPRAVQNSMFCVNAGGWNFFKLFPTRADGYLDERRSLIVDEWVPLVVRIPVNGQRFKSRIYNTYDHLGDTRWWANWTHSTEGWSFFGHWPGPATGGTGTWGHIDLAYAVFYKGNATDADAAALMTHLVDVSKKKGLSKPLPRMSWTPTPGAPATVKFQAYPATQMFRSVSEVKWDFGDGTVYTSSTDTKTALLLQCEGLVGSQVITDEKGHTVTVEGNTNIQNEVDAWNIATFGSGSAYFDGAGDRLAIPYHADFGSPNGDWTLEFWVYDAVTGTKPLFHWGDGANNYIQVYLKDNEELHLEIVVGGVNVLTSPCDNYTHRNAVWNHVAIIKRGQMFTVCIGGVASVAAPRSRYSACLANSLPAWEYPMYFGWGVVGGIGTYTQCYLGSLRFSKEPRYDIRRGLHTSMSFPPPTVLPTVDPDKRVEHEYTAPGTYVVSCEVTDSAGEKHIERDTLYINTLSVPPVPRFPSRTYGWYSHCHSNDYYEQMNVQCVAAYLFMDNDDSRILDYSGLGNHASKVVVDGAGITFTAAPTTGYSVKNDLGRDCYRVAFDANNPLFWQYYASRVENQHLLCGDITYAALVKRTDAGTGTRYIAGWGSQGVSPTNGAYFSTDGNATIYRSRFQEYSYFNGAWAERNQPENSYGVTYNTWDFVVRRREEWQSQASTLFHYPAQEERCNNSVVRTASVSYPSFTSDFTVLGDASVGGLYGGPNVELAALVIFRGHITDQDCHELARYLNDIKTIKGL